MFLHVMADVARLPVLKIVLVLHFLADLTLDMGEVVHD
jgi:acetoacetate decarboxylase